jgi:hypothetical protein
MLGAQDANQAASLEYQRRQTSMTILASLFDSLRRYRKLTGRVLLYIIQNYISPERMVRITSDNSPSYQPITAQAQSAKYDIIVDDAPTSPNQKEAAWQIIQQMLPMVQQQMTPDMMLTTLEYSPLPSSFIAKMKESVEKAQANPQPDPKLQVEMQKMAFEQEKAKADFQLEQQRMQSDADLKRMQIDAEISLKREQLSAELALKREQLAAELALKERMGMLNASAQVSSGVSLGGDPG